MASLRAELTGGPKPAVTLKTPEAPRDKPVLPDPVRVQPKDQGSNDQASGSFGRNLMLAASVLSLFWVGGGLAFSLGYFGLGGLIAAGFHVVAMVVAVTVTPPFLFLGAAYALARAEAMGDAARKLAQASDRLTLADETAINSAQRLGRAVRRELDALSAGLDGAFSRLRALETALEDRVAQLDDAGARAGVKTEAITQRLREEREGIEQMAKSLESAAARAAETLSQSGSQITETLLQRLRGEREQVELLVDSVEQSSARAAETLAGKSAQLKTMIESAGGELRSAGQVLEVQSTQFREAAERAAAAPQAAALELDRQAKQIESAADNAVSRAEFVLARQEKQRTAMNEMLTRLREETTALAAALDAQRRAVEQATQMLASEAQRVDALTQEGLKRIDSAMEGAAARSTQFAAGFGREAERVKEITDIAAGGMSRMVDALKEATTSAQALLADSTADAKRRSKDFVGEAMGQCDHLLRAASTVAEEAEKARASLAKAAEEAERHIIALPGIAAQEAERVRETLRSETEKMLDMSARALAAMQNRSGRKTTLTPPGEEPRADAQPAAASAATAAEPASEGLRGLARRITAAKRKAPADERSARGYNLSAVLAAAEASDLKPALRSGATAALNALQAALADIAVDLDTAIAGSESPDMWRRYLEGDRAVFARKLAGSVGPKTVNKIARLYRDDMRFHEAADAYLQEFESLLQRARAGDRDGLLASTLLSADTGKIYLTVAYALGRLD